MDEETKLWLEKAIESMTFDEVKRICEILDLLNKKEDGTKDDEKYRLN